MIKRLENKISLVTGAGQGIGKAIAIAFAREGSDVIICDLNLRMAKEAASQIESLGQRSLAVKVDVSNARQVERMKERVLKVFNHVDILVNNAGISKIVPFVDTTEELWDKILGVNLKGTFLICRAFVPQMIELKSGKIINMSSKSGKIANAWFAAYCASKFGVIGLTQSLALDLASYGINVNAICPGIVFTPHWDELMKDYAKKRGLKVSQVKDYLVGKIPLGRAQTPEDVAKMAVFLASHDSDYMTGQAINVTCGQEMR